MSAPLTRCTAAKPDATGARGGSQQGGLGFCDVNGPRLGDLDPDIRQRVASIQWLTREAEKSLVALDWCTCRVALH
jgi:hypothetical protein